jgi:hypothetical protein
MGSVTSHRKPGTLFPVFLDFYWEDAILNLWIASFAAISFLLYTFNVELRVQIPPRHLRVVCSLIGKTLRNQGEVSFHTEAGNAVPGFFLTFIGQMLY